MNCIVIEDQPPAQRILKKYLEDLDSIQLLEIFSDPVKALGYLQENTVDIIFLDINLPKLSGIDLLKSLSSKPQVILTTAHSYYALDGYELDIVDFLLKPFSFERFLKAIGKLEWKSRNKFQMSLPTRREYFIKVGYDHIRINFEDIIYLGADGDYCEIVIPGKKYVSSEPLKRWIEMLDGEVFFRIHKSYIINLRKIVKVNGTSVFLQDKVEIPIGRNFKEGFFKKVIKT
jgi:DNA-binding LytR/AlgR family response regulator